MHELGGAVAEAERETVGFEYLFPVAMVMEPLPQLKFLEFFLICDTNVVTIDEETMNQVLVCEDSIIGSSK